MPRLTKQGIAHIHNVLLILEHGQFKLTGLEVRAMNEAMVYLATLKAEAMQETQEAEAAQKAADELKAKEVADAVAKTREVLNTLVAPPPDKAE